MPIIDLSGMIFLAMCALFFAASLLNNRTALYVIAGCFAVLTAVTWLK